MRSARLVRHQSLKFPDWPVEAACLVRGGCKSRSRAPKPATQPAAGAAADFTLYGSNQSAARPGRRARLPA